MPGAATSQRYSSVERSTEIFASCTSSPPPTFTALIISMVCKRNHGNIYFPACTLSSFSHPTPFNPFSNPFLVSHPPPSQYPSLRPPKTISSSDFLLTPPIIPVPKRLTKPFPPFFFSPPIVSRARPSFSAQPIAISADSDFSAPGGGGGGRNQIADSALKIRKNKKNKFFFGV